MPKETEFPAYDSCKPCPTLKPVKTQIGSGYGCEVCQMTYIQVEKGAFIPFDQAMKLATEKRERAEARKARANQQLRAKPPKRKKRKKRYR